MVELLAAYWKFAEGYYRKNGQPTGWTSHIRLVICRLKEVYGRTPAADFGSLSLKAFRRTLIDAGHCRSYINKIVAIMPAIFKWGVGEELVPVTTYQALAAVPGLRKGRSEAPETDPVEPVSESDFQATLPLMPLMVADMTLIQRLTGCRPGKVCVLRPCDVDRSGDVWSYVPESHKTEHHGRARVVHIGPKAQAILTPYLLREAAKNAACDCLGAAANVWLLAATGLAKAVLDKKSGANRTLDYRKLVGAVVCRADCCGRGMTALTPEVETAIAEVNAVKENLPGFTVGTTHYTTTTTTTGRQIAERLGVHILGIKGHDLKCACVSCKSSDAMRIHEDSGVSQCYACGKAWSAFDLCKVVVGHEDAIKIMVDAGLFEPPKSSITSGNGQAAGSNGKQGKQKVDPIAEVERKKNIPPGSLKLFGAEACGVNVVAPMYDPDGKQCSSFCLPADGSKGLNAKGKPVGLFLQSKKVEAGQTVHLVEGINTLASLGLLAVGLPGSAIHERFSPMFQGSALSEKCFSLGGHRHEAFGQVDDLSGQRPYGRNR